jgi:hypothetical protein
VLGLPFGCPQAGGAAWRPTIVVLHGSRVLVAILDEQCGIVTLRQAFAAGLTKSAVRARIDAGRWQRMHTGVFATFNGPPPRPALLWAAAAEAHPGYAHPGGVRAVLSAG